MQSTSLSSQALAALCALILLPAAAAHAQVLTNSQALDSLGGAPDAQPKPQEDKHVQAVPPQHRAPPAVKKENESSKKPGTAKTNASSAPAQPKAEQAKAAATPEKPAAASKAPPAHTPPAATIPPAPPPVPQLTEPPSDIELHPFPVPPQPTVELKAVGEVQPLPNGVRITFAAGSADLNPTTHQAILGFGQRLSDKPHVRAMIDAYSSGMTDDPSLPRRMALSRGLAARSVLMNGGIPSTRIYLRIIGIPKGQSAKPDTAQDHIDIYQSDAAPS
ncbi:MAG: hypothetical protein ACTIDN_09295 [Acetobacter sp.]|uniref:hypothetical protein n=1 Tax=Acetobacter sp. TaxID=440 RepID=UPI003F910A2C